MIIDNTWLSDIVYINANCYNHAPTKFREGNVFKGVCYSVQGVGYDVTCRLAHVPFGGRVPYNPGRPTNPCKDDSFEGILPPPHQGLPLPQKNYSPPEAYGW